MSRYTVVIVPQQAGWYAALVPAMPGCVSQGRTRGEALANVQAAMFAWAESEVAQGRQALAETSRVVLDGVAQALDILDEMRKVGELEPDAGYILELATVLLRQPLAA
ncbi:MAG: type II toxin-antitoxin system HicB family antitoxin [Chloroflexota bacterium]